MKVTIETRQVYHKYAQVEIEIPNDWKDSDGLELQDYLIARDDLYTDKIDKAISEAKYEYGFGTDSDANSQAHARLSQGMTQDDGNAGQRAKRDDTSRSSDYSPNKNRQTERKCRLDSRG